MSQKGSDGRGSCELDRFGDELGDGKTDAGDGKDEEDGTFNQDGGQGCIEGNASSASPPDNVVGEVGIHSHTRGEGDREVRKEAHEDASNHGSNGSGRDVLAFELLETLFVFRGKDVAIGGDTGSTRIGQNARVDGKNVGHGQESGGSGLDFGCEGALATLEFEELSDFGFTHLGVEVVDKLHLD